MVMAAIVTDSRHGSAMARYGRQGRGDGFDKGRLEGAASAPPPLRVVTADAQGGASGRPP